MQGNEANATIFSNWKEYVYAECNNIVEAQLAQSQYDQLRSREDANTICEKIIEKLSSVNHHFKYITNCIILAAGSNGMDMAGLCFWDQEMDGSVTVKWESKSLTCIVTVHGVAI